MNYLKKLRMLMVAVFLITPLLTNAANVTIQVLKSDGTPLQGVSHILTAPYATNMGSTDADGLLSYTVADGTHTFQVAYMGTSKTITVPVSGTQTLTFYTTAVNATVAACSPTVPVAGVELTFQAAYYLAFPSNTNASGQSSVQLFPGTYNVTASYKGTSETKSVIVAGDGLTGGVVTPVTYTPTTVVLGNVGSKTYFSGYTWSADGTLYMFPGTYPFTFASGHTANLTITGCSQNMTVNILVLKDHNNNPLSGGTGRGGSGTNFSSFHVSGSTNAEGVLFDIRNNASTTMSYEMTYNKTTAVLTQTSNNVYSYKTIQLKLKLETCNGAPLSGGAVRYGHGSVATSYFLPGVNSTNASGESAVEFFPGTYSFEMGISSSKQEKTSVVVPNANTTLVWKTTAVTLNWPHAISYGGAGDSRFFNAPTMELLPGTLNFNFRTPNSNNYVPLTISGCTQTLTPGIVRLVNSANQPLSGGEVSGYQGGWSTYGTTGANGNVLVLTANPAALKMTYAGGTQQLNVNMGVTPIVTFQTKAVTMELKDAEGSHLEGTGLSYYAGGWNTFGSGMTTGGVATMELLPLTYSFKLSYAGGTQQISNQNVNTNQLVSYHTKTVTMELKDANGNYIDGGVDLSFHSDSWRTFGAGITVGGTATMQLLPVSYSFKLSYKGTAKQLPVQDVNVNQLVSYQTAPVTVSLKDQNGDAIEGGVASFYTAGSWQTMGTTDANGNVSTEFLPASYSFKMVYNAKSNQKTSMVVPGDVVFFYNTNTNLFRHGSTEDEPTENAVKAVASAMELYPNPVTDRLNIKFYSESEKTATVKVLDISGKVIVSESFVATEGSNTHMIDLSHLSTGAYFIMLHNVDVEAKRIVVQH